jgi:hypothetical protein
MGQCGTMAGGKHRKGHKKTRKMRGGVGYGFGNAIGTNGPEWVPSNTSVPMNAAGQVLPDPYGTNPNTNAYVGGKRRSRRMKTKKGSKKSKRRRSRKMRGGMTPGSVNAGAVGTGFVGGIPGFPTGAQGYGAYAGYPAHVPGGDPHRTGPDGVKQL